MEKPKQETQAEPPATTPDPMKTAVINEAYRQGLTLTEAEIDQAVKRAKRMQRKVASKRSRPKLNLRG